LIVIRLLVILVVSATFAPLASAQPDEKWRVRHVNIENDDVLPVFAGGPSDRFYTHGLRVFFGKRIFDASAEPDTLPAWARIAANRCSACSIYPTFSVGQEAYTPQFTELPEPQPGEHPWASWLYGAVGAIVDTPGGGRHQYQLQIGVTGDSTQAKELQDFWHRLINRPEAEGWDNQLGSDAGINAYYRFRTIWRRSDADSRVQWDFGPTVGAAFGTMRTHATFGGIARIGRHAGDALDPPIEGSVEPPLWPVQFDKVRIYGFLGANVSVVGHNYFLEGSRFHDDPLTVKREKVVGELALGVTARYNGWALTYTIIRRSRDFERLVGEDSSSHSYGSLMITRGFR
jgi:lipid A 3-O-deacylase